MDFYNTPAKSPEEAQIRREKEEEFQKQGINASKNLGKQKENLQKSLYPTDKTQEELKKEKKISEEMKKLIEQGIDEDLAYEQAIKTIEENQLKEKQQNPEEKIKENYEKLTSKKDINKPENSVLNRLIESGKLTAETNEILEISIETNLDFNKEFEESITNKDDLSIIQDTINLIPENKESIPVDNLYNFKEDFPELSDIAINGVEAKGIKKGEEPKSEEILAYEYIGENYIKIGDNPEDKDKNYSTAIKTASANILKNNTTIDKETIKFQQAILNIHSDNKENQFKGLATLVGIKEEEKTENGAIANKLKLKTKPKLKKQLENLKAEAKVLEKNKNNDTEYYETRKKEIKEEYDKINELLGNNKIEGGEIKNLSGGDEKIEKVSGNND